MLGWELPPFNSGGLGTACEGLTKALSSSGEEIDFVMPKNFAPDAYPWMKVIDASDFSQIGKKGKRCLEMAAALRCALLNGYYVPGVGDKLIPMCRKCLHGFSATPYNHVNFYTAQARNIAASRDFDIIHAHDWFTYLGAIEAQKVAEERGMDIPLVVHCHSTQVDRAGGNVHPGDIIFQIEKAGFEAADIILAVSNYTKEIIKKYYGVDEEKITVVHNGIDMKETKKKRPHALKKKFQFVLFFGRITLQKGPDYFLRVAKKVTDVYPDVKFLMVGTGDMEARMIEQAADMDLTTKVMFTGYIPHDTCDDLYQMSDIFVLPSVSEPFGITPLEAIQNGVPAIVSKNSGVSEVLENIVKVDFWDVDKTAEAIIDLLKNPQKAKELTEKAALEMRAVTWDKTAKGVKKGYEAAKSKKKVRQYA